MTADEFYDLLITEKENITELDGLTSTSQTAIWRLLYYATANVLQYQSDLQQEAIDKMEDIRVSSTEGHRAWFIWFSKNFYQYNTNPDKGQLKIGTDYNYYYDVIDEDSQIIDYCAALSSANNGILKVAKTDIDDNIVALTASELASYAEFIDNIKPYTLNIGVQSFSTDWLTFDVDIYTDNTGVPTTDITNDINNNVNEYLKTLEFDGTIYQIDIVDVIQAVNGVRNVVVNQMSGFDNAYSTEGLMEKDNGNTYKTISGYATLDTVRTIINFK